MNCYICTGECNQFGYVIEKDSTGWNVIKQCDPGAGEEIVKHFDWEEHEAAVELLNELKDSL